MGLAWPDFAIGLLLVIGALRGFKRGFVQELVGAVALGFAIAAGFAYGGMWDRWLHSFARIGVGSAHVVGIILYAIMAYAVVHLVGMALAAVAKLPIIGSVNAVAGAVVGAAKVLVLCWIIVYVALFFPLDAQIRDDMHRSHLVVLLETPNAKIDANLRQTLPAFVRPYAGELFLRHRV